MKKYLTLFIAFAILFVVIECAKDNTADGEHELNYDVNYTADYLSSEYYIFDHSDNIVKAKLIDIGSWGGIAVYEFKVNKEYYGELADTTIHVYKEEDVRYKIGREYYLFLINNGKFEDGNIRYNMCSRHIFFPANKRVYEYGYGQMYTLKQKDIPDMILKAAATREEREK